MRCHNLIKWLVILCWTKKKAEKTCKEQVEKAAIIESGKAASIKLKELSICRNKEPEKKLQW